MLYSLAVKVVVLNVVPNVLPLIPSDSLEK